MKWLQLEMEAWKIELEGQAKPAGLFGFNPKRTISSAQIAEMLAHWKVDGDLAGVRDEETLSKLPEDERKA